MDNNDKLRIPIEPPQPHWYSDRVASWLSEFAIKACNGCYGRFGKTIGRHSRAYADVAERFIHCAEAGRTAATLLTWAHEIGHIVLRHGGHTPRYLEEFEATILAVRLLRRDGIAVPRRALDAYRRYVARKVLRRSRRGLPIRRDVLRWCRLTEEGLREELVQ
jgi:uncharacterized protein YjhX (UPF0386 family)